MKFYLIGQNINHSLSPIIHNRAFNQLEINADYELFDTQNLNAIKKLMDKKDFKGANITTPYKDKLVNSNIILSEESLFSSSINTVYLADGKLYATSTDGIGFYRSIKEKFNSICIFGLGATSKTIIKKLLDYNHSIELVVRDVDKALIWVENLKSNKINVHNILDIKKVGNIIYNCSIILDATGLSRKGESVINKEIIRDKHLCIDLNYGINFKSKFLMDASEKGARTKDGIDMLVYQACESFYLWTGKRFDEEEMINYLEREYVKR